MWRNHSADDFARLLLDNCADPNVRASLRKRMRLTDQLWNPPPMPDVVD